MSDLPTTPGPWSVEPSRPSQLPIGGTLALMWRVFARAPWQFVGLNLLPFLVGLVPRVEAITSPTHRAGIVTQGVAAVVQIALQMVLQGAVTFGAWKVTQTGSFSTGEAMNVGFRRAFALLGVSLLQMLIVIVGFLLLIVPGIIVALAFGASIGACIIEELGPAASLKRSWALTRGNRWRILGLGILLVGCVMVLMIASVAVAVTAIVFGHVIGTIVAVPIALALFLAITSMLSVLPAALFVQLRGDHDATLGTA